MFNLWKRSKSDDSNGAKGGRHGKAAPPIKQTAGYGLVWNGYEVAASVVSDVGCQRETNEDCGRYISPTDSDAAINKGVLMLVADGVGGNSAGEVASRTAADVISRVYYEHASDMQSALIEAFREANRAIHQAAATSEELRGMGTTCSALALNNGTAISANVGDSRLYLIRDEEIYLMTEDHSVVGELVKHGLISREEARRHPDKNVIVSALGGATEVSVATWDAPLPIRLGDNFVVCSDGLSDLVEDKEIKETVIAAPPDTACQNLVALAKERGGHDNITVGILGVKPAGMDVGREMRVTRDLELAK
jgi:protein phosphatase